MIVIPGINNDLPLDKAELIAFFLESLLYGVSLLLFFITIWVIVYHRKTERLNKRLLFTSCLMMFFGTLHLAIDLSRILQGFLDERDAPGGPIGYFAKLFLWSHVFKTAIFAVQTVLADSFATYRCWVVWGRSWAIFLPALFVVGTFITGVGIVHGCAVLKDGENVFASSLTGWITSFFTLTLTTNIVCTSLIAIRIWYTTRKVSRFSGQQTLMPTFPIISIVFNLIIVRIALGIAHGGASGIHTNQNPTAMDATRSYMTNGHTQYPLKPLAVTVTQLVHKETDQEETPVKDRDSFNSEGAGKESAWNAV
ncbi:hypothetical protein Clacol_004736 [Clathrus columnatus]|uniref:Uncharacterized protein n=1 Tax=Clathrus columnatus TaxID=1419009 RepID=A0AAV5AEY3_9AGAM|nr:hypothetical protein Clacol_004736 [Clathrus columnatus]